MKNIYILPTDKLSKLYYHSDLEELVLTNKTILGKFVTNKNIYITNDEKIENRD